MEKQLVIEGEKAIFSPNSGVSLAGRILIKNFLKILKKLAKPILVTITAQIVKAAAENEDEAETFLRDVLDEIDTDGN